ncbi:MAG: fasciclin domain-containing protein [Saprospiraceae bacterium]|nr:fasciclin domain-containing protein [Saprospiraceae bacterium]
MKKLFFGMFLALSASLLFTACKDDDDPTTAKNIVETAQATSELSSLVAALSRAGLVDALNAPGPFTVFAPTNAAFSTFLSANGFATLEDVPVPVLQQILLNHVVSGEVRAAGVPTEGYVKTLATFGTSNLSILAQNNASGVSINKEVKVTTADVLTSNGVVHIVDKVIALPTVVNHALNNANFSILVAALTRPSLGVDYVGLLSGTGPFTVFAPTNAAFAALLTELGLSSLDQVDDATLNAVLQYHVVSGANVLASQLTNGQEVTTFGTGKFTINLTGGAKIVDARNRTTNIIITDVQGTNGVVHAVDRVLLP